MALEIERKFLVRGDWYKSLATSATEIKQGYLNRDPDRTVRVRVCGNAGMLTIKSRNCGCVRNEWEYEIPRADAEQLLSLCSDVIAKTRYRVGRWEIDEFHGKLSPLVLAEIELNDAAEAFELPDFVGDEVTGDARYYNSNLARGDE